jgi:hypothetical protein
MAKNNQVARVEPEAEASPAGREAPTLKPACIEVQSEGYRWREWLLRAPAEMTLQDLNEPSIFRIIQQSLQKSVRQLDRITVLSHDESWCARDLLVVEADSNRVVLSIRPNDVIRMPSKSSTWQDDRHVVKWAGSGYAAFRRDGDVLLGPHTYSTIEACKAVLFKDHYSKAVVR